MRIYQVVLKRDDLGVAEGEVARLLLPVPVRMQQLLNLAGVPLKDDPPRIELPPPDFKPVEVYDRNRILVSTL